MEREKTLWECRSAKSRMHTSMNKSPYYFLTPSVVLLYLWNRGDSHDPLQLAQDVHTCMLTCNIHIYAYFKCSILPLVWPVCLRECGNTRIVEQIVATAWEVCMQLAICESREHTLFLHNHGWASWHCWRSSPALGARQPPQSRWQQQSKLCTLKCCLPNRRELKQLRENLPAVFRTLALAALDKV